MNSINSGITTLQKQKTTFIWDKDQKIGRKSRRSVIIWKLVVRDEPL